ncbi:membrane or secreted protein [Formosa haliotis]|uniref:membrane or secreted protein n=1 Tax=Formosa haliotis TaxID=1555194 RepID=UPI0008256188|nr:membrane or secreted protein [Formosa haliotis]
MKTNILVIFGLMLSYTINAQSLVGAWEYSSTSKAGESVKQVLIVSDGFQATSTYNETTGAFMSTSGGAWTLKGDMLTEHIEFNSANPEQVGTEVAFKITLTDDSLHIVDQGITFKRIDAGMPGQLQGAWLMSGRVRDGKTQSRPTDVPRKTMKILSGTRFQWIAYNTETKEFKGTGGGTYTTINNEYTENIQFFSKDDSRVGQSLKFNYELIDGHWHHTGLSSKGDPIHEIWSKRK